MNRTVFVNARFLSQSVTGVQRYAIELSKRLRQAPGDINFRFLTPNNILHHDLAETLGAEICGRLTGHAWEQLELPYYTRGHLLLSLCNTAPLSKRHQIVTFHDAAVFAMPDSFSPAFRNWYKVLMPGLGRVAQRIITISEFSKRELMHYCHVPERKLTVTYQSGEQILTYPPDPSILGKHDLTERPFVFAVSSLNPSKNFQAVIEAANILGDRGFDFVIAGGSNSKVFQASQQDLSGNVKYLGYVSNEELRALYEHAACYLMPSLYEGFGLTPLEAMTCGCPVLVSNAASLPEVCGDAALYCDPRSPEEIAAKLQRLMGDAALRETLRQKGLKRAEQFSWDKCALETLAVVERVLA
ncbi:glycosyltransferase family 1 protein [soil metagenome]